MSHIVLGNVLWFQVLTYSAEIYTIAGLDGTDVEYSVLGQHIIAVFSALQSVSVKGCKIFLFNQRSIHVDSSHVAEPPID